MKPGSVIVDLAASSGGNCTETRDGEIYTTSNGVTIIGKLDQLPAQASQLYGNNLCHLLDDMGKGTDFKIDMSDDVISRAMVTHDGKVNWPPEPLPVSPQKPKQIESESAKTPIVKAEKKRTNPLLVLFILGAILYLLALVAPPAFMGHFTVFVLSCFVGWQVIWNVSHSLHTPLMAVTNAISGIIIIGGLLQTKASLSDPMSILALIAILVASINIIGGFLVTHRMLNMFKK